MPSFDSVTIANQTYMVNTAITDLILPEATGGDGALSYAITPALPPGLSFNTDARPLKIQKCQKQSP
jgi:hypothetical protein